MTSTFLMSFQVAFLRDSPRLCAPLVVAYEPSQRARPETARCRGHVGTFEAAPLPLPLRFIAFLLKWQNVTIWRCSFFILQNISFQRHSLPHRICTNSSTLPWKCCLEIKIFEDPWRLWEGHQRWMWSLPDHANAFCAANSNNSLFTLCRFVWYFMWDAFSSDAWGLGRSSQRDAKAESMIKLHQCINDTEEHKEVIRIAVQQDYDKFELFDWNLKGIIGIRTSDKFQHRHIMQHSPQIYGLSKAFWTNLGNLPSQG